LAPCSGDPGILVGQIEILGIGILDPGLVAWLLSQPLKEAFDLGEGRTPEVCRERSFTLTRVSIDTNLPLWRTGLLTANSIES
jgi:hypothetical protein